MANRVIRNQVQLFGDNNTQVSVNKGMVTDREIHAEGGQYRETKHSIFIHKYRLEQLKN